MIGGVPNLTLIETEAGQHFRIGQHLLGVEPAVDPAQHPFAPRIVAVGEVELADVRPVILVARLRELLGPGIRIQPVVQAGADVKTCPPVRFDASSTVTSCPRRTSSHAQLRPAIPAPATITRLAGRCCSGSGTSAAEASCNASRRVRASGSVIWLPSVRSRWTNCRW